MRNRWLNEINKFKIGDLVYWIREEFEDADWDVVIKLYGKFPMKVIEIYHDLKYGAMIEVLTGGIYKEYINPKNVRKVSSDFIAKK